MLSTLQQQIPGIKLTGVELRPAVIDAAYRFFQLPRSKKMKLIEADANVFLADGEHKKVDILFADLYHGQGLDTSQLEARFISQCQARLKANGWLVLNCWTEHSGKNELVELLMGEFADVRACHTSSGNWLVFAGKTTNKDSLNQLKNKAQVLSNGLGYNLQRYVSNLYAVD